jgi:polysaccharide biosynthesis transport protein
MSDSLDPRPIDLREVMRIAWRRRWLLVVPWLVALLGGVAAAMFLPPIYESSVTMVLQRPSGLPDNLSGKVATIDPSAQVDFMREQVRSSLFLSSVITAAGLRTDPTTHAWALRGVKRYPGASEAEAIDAYLVDYLRDAIAVKLAKGGVFQVVVADRFAVRAQHIAESVASQFMASSKSAQMDAVRRTGEFSSEQQSLYKQRLDESEAKLEAYRREVLSSTVVNSSITAANVAHARTLLDQARLEADDLSQRIGTLRNQLAGQVRDEDLRALSSPEVLSLSGQMASLERQLASATLNDLTGDGSNGLKLAIVRKHAELASELALGASKALPNLPQASRDIAVDYRVAQSDLAGVVARRDWLDRQVTSYDRNVVMTPEHEIEVNRLAQEVENNRALYTTFLQQSSATQIAEAFQNAKLSGNFVILEPARRPLEPARPNRPVLILLALLAGGVVGVGTVLLVEHHDESVRNAEEVENLLGLPVVGAIPRVAELQAQRRRANPLAAAGAGVPMAREQGMLHRLKVESPLGLEFRRVYLKLAKSHGRSLPHTLALTSATRGEGKTTASACLAITLARELRQKVLLVDFDLRSPALHRALGLPSSSWGLSQMLQQRHFDERFVRATVLPHLEFLPAGKSERPAAELIESDVVEWFVREAASRYPLVIMDCAPNLAVPDPLILGRAVEGMLYVIKAGSTVRKAAEYGVKVQREARDNILGVLINDAGEILPSYYGYGYRTYGYAGESAGADS